MLGGGSAKFVPANDTNSEDGERRDGRNLINEWKHEKHYRGKAQYVSNREELLQVDIKHTDYLLGEYVGNTLSEMVL